MRVFVTGATGFIGSAIAGELIRAGHDVLGLARSDAAAQSLIAAGAEALPGALDDSASLKRGAALSDGVIHAAFIHDFTNYAAAAEMDRSAIVTFCDALAGSGRPFVVTSVTSLLTPGRLVTEDDVPDFLSASAARIPSEVAALSARASGVRVSVVRLPESVHGEGDSGFIPTLINIAREKGISAFVGDGLNRWPSVHRLDAARLYRLALENGHAGARYHAVVDEGVLLRDIAGVIGQRLNVPVIALSPAEATEHFGWLAHFLSIDNPVSSMQTRRQLRWIQRQPSLLADFDHQRYFKL